jgi:tetratricopeptide (TPR) repeat protein
MAGEHARAVYANAEALDHFRAALALGHPDPARLREMIGDLHTLRGEYGDAIGAYESAAAVTKAPTDLARLEHRLGGVYLRRGDWVVADAHLRAARQSGGDDLDAVTHARVLADRSLAASHLGADHDAVELAQAALELAEATGEQRALAQAHNIVGVIERRRGRLDDARRHLERSVELASNADDSAGRTAALNNLALAEAAAGDTDRALELLRTALGVCTMQGDRHREAAIHNNVADVLRAAGRTEDAMDHLKRAVTIFAEIGEPEAMEAEIWKLVDW